MSNRGIHRDLGGRQSGVNRKRGGNPPCGTIFPVVHAPFSRLNPCIVWFSDPAFFRNDKELYTSHEHSQSPSINAFNADTNTLDQGQFYPPFFAQ